MSSNSDTHREGQISRDRDTIQQWADDHDAVPVKEETAGGTDRYRLVPERNVATAHERADWDEFFDDLASSDDVVVYHGVDASQPFEVSRHDEVVNRVGDEGIEDRLLEGETVTTEIQETTTVESVVVEEITIDSELVDSEVVDSRVVDAELIGREATNCEAVDNGAVGDHEWFNAETYSARLADRAMGRDRAEAELGTVDGEFPYHAEMDVEEHWTVTMELTERFDVESEITGTDVSEADTIEDHEIDVSGLHHSIVESGIVGDRSTGDMETQRVVDRYDVESELAEDDRIHTSFTRERTVEDEVLDHKRVRAEATDADIVDMETIHTRDVEAGEVTDSTGEPMAETTDAATDTTTADAATTDPSTLDDDVIGKTVVDSAGEEIGMVSDVREDGHAVYVDTHPGITERIRTALGWGDASDDDYSLNTRKVQQVTDDEVRLKSAEHIDEGDRDR